MSESDQSHFPDFIKLWRVKWQAKWRALDRREAAGWVGFGVSFVSLLFLFVVYFFVSDTTPWGEYVSIWPPFFWLLPLAPLILISWSRKNWWRLPALLGVAAVFVLTFIDWPPLLRRGPSPEMDEFSEMREKTLRLGPAPEAMAIRLAVWNINEGSGGIDQYLEKLEPYRPDVCFFQETPDGRLSIQSEDLQQRWKDYYWWDDGDCGLLSRWPMRRFPSRAVGPWTPPQIGVVEAPYQPFIAVNVRLMLPSLVLNPLSSAGRRRLTADHRARLQQIRELGAQVRELQARPGLPLILAGDFNTPARMDSLDPLRRLLTDVWPLAGRGWGATMTNQFPVSRIDQCWVSERVEPVAAQVVEGYPSDHRLLVVDVLIERRR